MTPPTTFLRSQTPRRAFLLLGTLLLGCQAQQGAPPPAPEALFELAERSVLDWTYRNGMSGELYFPEIVGGGGGWIDFDNDGDLDLYLVQGQRLGPDSAPDPALHDRLYRNDLTPGADAAERRARFTDVTAESGLVTTTSFGMGVAVGDFDNDGWSDLYVTNFGSNQLWHNNGANAAGVVTFTDVTAESGTDDPRWSTSAAFVDIDHDGWLDLYAVSYVDFRIANHDRCVNEAGTPDFCGPRSFLPETDRLWRNQGPDAAGKVRFTDVSATAGLLDAPGPGLGVVTGDFDGNGLVDVYVANDQARNHLWLNLGGDSDGDSDSDGDIRLRESGLESGSAMDSQGRVQASMGVDAGDVDNDGDLDLFMTHLLREVNTLYLGDGNGLFTDRSSAAGLGSPSIGYTGFGTAFLDVDNDGDLDVVAVNGEVRLIPEQQAAGDPFPLRQPNQLFLNQGGVNPLFVDASHRVPALAEPFVSRGVMVGDVDNDGDVDILVTNNEDPVQLLLNQVGHRVSWIGFRLLGAGGRDMLGARVTLRREALAPLRRQVRTDGGYLTARDPRVHFGLDGADALAVEVRWPSGRCESWDAPEAGRYHTLTEGDGRPEETC
jgi:hypothetical protein